MNIRLGNGADLSALIDHAISAGASDAVVIPAADIVVDDALAELCRPPGCENYGRSLSCPPHVAGPQTLRRMLAGFSRALCLKIEVPETVLFSSQRREVFQLLHEIAAGVERAAVAMGCTNAQAYAGGSCLRHFCHDHPGCRALSPDGCCRHPDIARPSMSGFGIDVAALHRAAGWDNHRMGPEAGGGMPGIAAVSALVLID